MLIEWDALMNSFVNVLLTFLSFQNPGIQELQMSLQVQHLDLATA